MRQGDRSPGHSQRRELSASGAAAVERARADAGVRRAKSIPPQMQKSLPPSLPTVPQSPNLGSTAPVPPPLEVDFGCSLGPSLESPSVARSGSEDASPRGSNDDDMGV